MFDPLIIPLVLIFGHKMLTPGDHQVHHSHRRFNFGYVPILRPMHISHPLKSEPLPLRLFFRFWDKYYDTYRRCDVQAQDSEYWTQRCKEIMSDEGKVTVSQMVETQWGL